MRGGEDRHAEIDVLPGGSNRESAVLRQAFLGDVQTRHDLEARDDAGLQMFGWCEDRIEDAVDPIADDQPPFKRFEVDITGPLPNGLKEDGVDQSDDRGFVGRIEQVLRFVELVGQLVQAFVRCDILHHFLGACRIRNVVVGSIEPREERDSAGQDRRDWFPQQQAKIIQGDGFQRIGRCREDGSVFVTQRQNPVSSAKGDRHPFDDLVIDMGGVEMGNPGHVELLGQRFQHLFFPQGAQVQQYVS